MNKDRDYIPPEQDSGRNIQGFQFFKTYRDNALNAKFTDDQQKSVYKAIIDYMFGAVIPDFEDNMLQLYWGFVKPALDKTLSNILSGKKGGGQPGNQNARKTSRKRAENEQSISIEKNKGECKSKLGDVEMKSRTPTQTKPSIDEISAYFRDYGFKSDPKEFMNYCSNIGWDKLNPSWKHEACIWEFRKAPSK